MTALLLDAPTARVSTPVRASRRSGRRAPGALRHGIGRPSLRLAIPSAGPLPERLYWTRRGLAVALALVALVLGLMASTLTAAFLAVSDAPPARASAPARVPAVASVAG